MQVSYTLLERTYPNIPPSVNFGKVLPIYYIRKVSFVHTDLHPAYLDHIAKYPVIL